MTAKYKNKSVLKEKEVKGWEYDWKQIVALGSSSGGSPGWVPGHESAWNGNLHGPGNSICGGRRHSTVSDSGDTGIGTYCSDSVEGRMSWRFIEKHHIFTPHAKKTSSSLFTVSILSGGRGWWMCYFNDAHKQFNISHSATALTIRQWGTCKQATTCKEKGKFKPRTIFLWDDSASSLARPRKVECAQL